MGRKVNIIKHLKMMGYLVGEDTGTTDMGMVSIGLKTSSGHMVVYSVTEYELIYGEYMVERIVSKINELIINEF